MKPPVPDDDKKSTNFYRDQLYNLNQYKTAPQSGAGHTGRTAAEAGNHLDATLDANILKWCACGGARRRLCGCVAARE